MLRGDTGSRLKFRALLNVKQYGGQLNRFRAGAENQEQLAWAAHYPR